MNSQKKLFVSAALTGCFLAAAAGHAQTTSAPPGKPGATAPGKPAAVAPAQKNYLDYALATGASTGVAYADDKAAVEGQKTISGSKSYSSALPFFKDLKPWDPNYKPPRLADGHPDLQGIWSTASLTISAPRTTSTSTGSSCSS